MGGIMLHQQRHVFATGVFWLKPQASFKPRCYDQLLGWKCLVKMTVKVGVEGISKMVEEHDR